MQHCTPNIIPPQSTLTKSQPGVYLILHKNSGTCYIGSTVTPIRHRWATHRYYLRRNIHTNKHLRNAWEKYGEDGFAFYILENTAPEMAINGEQYWIDVCRLRGIRLYNIRIRAETSHGLKHSDETKQAISKKNKGRIKSAEEIANISASLKGKQRPHLMKAITKHWPPLVDPDGNVHEVYNLKAFCRARGLSMRQIRRVALGQHPEYQGWRLLKDGEQPVAYDQEFFPKKRSRNVGEKHPMHKLTDAAVWRIRQRYTHGEVQSVIAKDYDISRETVSMIVTRKRWTHVP